MVTTSNDLEALSVVCVYLFLKMWAVGLYTGYCRWKEKSPSAPEDRDVPSTEAVSPMVERALSMHRNDLENIPIFLIICGFLFLSSASRYNSTAAHVTYYAVFAAARTMHSLCFALALQPWRSVSYAVGLAATTAASIHLLVQAFSLPFD